MVHVRKKESGISSLEGRVSLLHVHSSDIASHSHSGGAQKGKTISRGHRHVNQ